MSSRDAERPNVLFLLSDEHNFRFFGHLDPDTVGEPVDTPALSGLQANSTVFEGAYCAAPLCTPSRLCMLTSRRAPACDAWANNSLLRPGLQTLPETLRDAGYETSLVGKMHLGGTRQFVGFDHRPYGDFTGIHGHQADPPSSWYQPRTLKPDLERGEKDIRSRTRDAGVTGIPESLQHDQTVVRESVAYLREQAHRNPDQPWFHCASFVKPHFPLTAPRRHFERYWPDGVTPPKVPCEGDAVDHPQMRGLREMFRTDEIDEEETLRGRAGYFAAVSYVDEMIGDLLGMLEADGLLENTVVVYASDHGESAGEFGTWWKSSWHEASARVPLSIQLPDQRNGGRSPSRLSTPVSLIDLYPTLCGLVDAPFPDDLDGVDLSSSVRSGREPDRPPVVCDNLVSDNFITEAAEGTEFRMVRDGTYKYVGFRDAPELLFDLEADPREQHNLAPDATGADRDALERLRGFVGNTIDFEAVVDRRERRPGVPEEYELAIPKGSGNAYLMPDGRILDAGATLYYPHVLSDNPEKAYDDFPGGE